MPSTRRIAISISKNNAQAGCDSEAMKAKRRSRASLEAFEG
jgi:hypothetical protein